jgi:pimeloyl-ACP methyl ester carboxylesterase
MKTGDSGVAARQLPQERSDVMKHHTITGGGGVQLHLVETGDAGGRAILFIHGFSQCWLAWSRQLNSDLADRYRLVAMDMRGHGQSEKPRTGYADSRLCLAQEPSAEDLYLMLGYNLSVPHEHVDSPPGALRTVLDWTPGWAYTFDRGEAISL